MQDNDVYALTPRGEKELRSGTATLSPSDIELMVRTDGVLTFGQVKASLPTVSAEVLTATLKRLLDMRMVSLTVADPFAEQFQIQLNNRALSLAGPEADAGAASLAKTGYYVSIARKHAPVRKLAPGQLLSAIVVDDEEMLAKFIGHYLTFEGFQVRIAGNRTEIVEEFRKLPIPDLVLLDVMLPDADGFDILLRIRQHPALKEVPVIMLTGVATREAVIKGLAGGADGYITKPFEADVLMRVVRSVVGLSEPKPQTDAWGEHGARL